MHDRISSSSYEFTCEYTIVLLIRIKLVFQQKEEKQEERLGELPFEIDPFRPTLTLGFLLPLVLQQTLSDTGYGRSLDEREIVRERDAWGLIQLE